MWAGPGHIPADVLRVGRVQNTPVMDVEDFTELRRTGLLTTAAALNLAGVKVLQDSAGRGGWGVGWSQRLRKEVEGVVHV